MSGAGVTVDYRSFTATHNQSRDRWDVTCSVVDFPASSGGVYLPADWPETHVKDALIALHDVMVHSMAAGRKVGRLAAQEDMRNALGLE